METVLISPAKAFVFGFPTVIFSFIIPVIGVAMFTYIIALRLKPMVKASPDLRLDRLFVRFLKMLKYAVGQYRHPRYPDAGIIHIMLFAGFVILSLRSITLVLLGISDGYVLPGMSGMAGQVYMVLKDIAGTLILAACLAALYRRIVIKPKRYAVPPKYGKEHTWEAVLVLLLIFACSTASAEVFRHIGPDGEVYFSDRPVAGAERVDLGPAQSIRMPTVTPRSAATQQPADVATDAQEAPAPSYAQFTVVKPSYDQGVRANDGSVTVYLSLQPALMPGHTIVLTVDGEDGEKIHAGETLNFNLSDMSRGRHVVTARVVDEQGNEQVKTGPVGFYVLRVALGRRAGTQ